LCNTPTCIAGSITLLEIITEDLNMCTTISSIFDVVTLPCLFICLPLVNLLIEFNRFSYYSHASDHYHMCSHAGHPKAIYQKHIHLEDLLELQHLRDPVRYFF